MMLTREQQADLRSRLEQERDRLQRMIDGMEAEIEQLANYEEAEQATLSNHPADSGTELFEQEQRLTLERTEQEVLGLVEHALERMDEGVYGQCERCGQPILVERLEFLPYATFCVACQADTERDQAQAR